jgi:hypothetical protein
MDHDPLHHATEDLEHDPDGVPHIVIGLTAVFSVGLAIVLTILLFTGRTTAIAAIAFAGVAIPVLVSRLERKAEREREHDYDHDHHHAHT